MQDHLFSLEGELGLPDHGTVIYVLFDGGDSWCVRGPVGEWRDGESAIGIEGDGRPPRAWCTMFAPPSPPPAGPDACRRRRHGRAGPGNPLRRIQAAPPSLSTFASRKALPEAWRGLRDATLADATGVADAVFIRTRVAPARSAGTLPSRTLTSTGHALWAGGGGGGRQTRLVSLGGRAPTRASWPLPGRPWRHNAPVERANGNGNNMLASASNAPSGAGGGASAVVSAARIS